MKRSRLVAVAAVVLTAAFAAGCGDSGSSGSSSTPSSGGSSTTTTLTPKSGGVLTYGSLAEVASLDPVKNSGSGNSGGTELFAMYDSLMGYDTVGGKFYPRIAESFTPNAEQSVWTMKLRSGVKFSDGNTLDAAAVIYNTQRQIDAKGRSINLVNSISKMESPDPLTVVFTLTGPNSTMPYSFSQAPGAIASPAAVKASTWGDTTPGKAGAGAFMLSSFKAKESITFDKNPNYYGGQVYLDGLKFVVLATQQTTFDSLQSGTLQAAFIRDPTVLASARDAKFSDINIAVSAGNSIEINNGLKVSCKGGQPSNVCAGQADGTSVATKTVTSDKRIRQAVAYATNVQTLSTRVWNGKAEASTDLLAKTSNWYSGVAGPQFDLEKAKSLVATVKAEGQWDGTIRVDCHSGLPDFATAMNAMLTAAGFKVVANDNRDVTANIALVQTSKDFDLACFGASLYNEEPFAALAREYGSTGWNNQTVKDAIAAGQKAPDDAGKKAALATIAKAYTEDVPFLGLNHVIQAHVFGKTVHGMNQSVGAAALFDKAWIG